MQITINAVYDDGSCVYPLNGCTDPAASNYNPDALTDDGSCKYDVSGCMDSEATNYNPEATVDNGSCVYGEVDDTPDLNFCKYPRLWNESGGVSYITVLSAYDNMSDQEFWGMFDLSVGVFFNNNIDTFLDTYFPEGHTPISCTIVPDGDKEDGKEVTDANLTR